MSEQSETNNSEEQSTQTEQEQSGSLVTSEATTEEKIEEGKTEEEGNTEEKSEEAAEVVPVTAETLVIPEGLEVPEESRDKFLEIMNNGELSPTDRANALLNLQAETMKAAQETASDAWAQTQTKWQEEVKADPEIGGAKLQPALTNIGKLLDEYGSPELRQVFDLTGAGNNVHVIKFLSKIAAQHTEGSFASGNATGNEASVAATLFPSMKG